MINTLKDLDKKKGQEFVDHFLNEKLTITEKLDTYRFSFKKEKDEIKFYKKDHKEINLIERTLTDIWDKVILEIPILIGETKLPEVLTFGVAYFPAERPIRIPYSNLPYYVLTDVTKRENKKVVEVFEYNEVKEWAKILNMGRPPIIFEGKLDEFQQKSLLDYDKRIFNAKNDSFSGIVSRKIGKTYSGEDTIEGIILKDGQNNIAQVISYEFELLNEAYKKSISSNRDFYDLIILSLNTFMSKYHIPIFEAKNPDQIYINIVSDIFNNYLKNNPISESLKPQFLTPPKYGYSGKLNTKFIENEETKKLLEKGEIYESLFKLFLSSLRKYKKEYGLLTESDVRKFNTHVGLINNSFSYFSHYDEIEIINEHFIDPLATSTIDEGKSSDNIVVKAYTKRKASDIDNMRVIASIQKSFEPASLDVRRGEENCIVYITDFTPFTKSQMENIYAMYRSWKVPVIIGTISSNRRIKGEKFYFTDSLLKAQLDSIKVFNQDIIPNYFILEDWNLKKIFEFTRPHYEPIAIMTDKGKKSEFVIQLFFEDEIMGGRINVAKDLNIGEMEIDDKVKSFRTIENGSFYKFKEHVPQSVLGLYDSMVQEFRTWNGQIAPTK